jgi:hypothetical protein
VKQQDPLVHGPESKQAWAQTWKNERGLHKDLRFSRPPPWLLVLENERQYAIVVALAAYIIYNPITM